MADGGTGSKQILIHRIPYDFQCIETEVVIEGEDAAAGKYAGSIGLVDGLEEFEYSCTINRTKFYGCGQLPIDITEGDADFEAWIKIDRFWFDYLCEKADEFNVGLGNLVMRLSLAYHGKKSGETYPTTHVDTLTGVRLAGIKNMGQHGRDPLLVELPLEVMNIYWDGRDIFGHTI